MMFEWIEIATIPHLIVLNARLRQTLEGDPEKQRIQEYFLEQLPYSLSAAAMALVTLVKSQLDAPSCIPNFPKDSDRIGVVLLPDHVKNMMAYPIDNYFDSARRVQNAANTYISKVLKLSVPSSMADLIKDVEQNKLVLPDDIKPIVTKYWAVDGFRIKQYRDLSQHFAVVSSDARLFRIPKGPDYIYIVLPNNPSEKNPALLRYDNPRVDAFDYIFRSYIMLYEYVYVITLALLSYTTGTDRAEISILFKSPLPIGARQPEGHPIPNLGNMVLQINKHRDEIARKYS